MDKTVDVLVLGSGAAGLTAALVAAAHGMQVLLCEKDALIGGTTATSGGTCWVPGNHHAKARNADDTLEQAALYLDRETGAPDTDGRRAAFLASAGPAFQFVEENSACKFVLPAAYPDYHPGQEGWMNGGRVLQPMPFDGRLLGRDFALLRPPNPGMMIVGGLMVNRPEAQLLARPWSSRSAAAFTMRVAWRLMRDRLRYPRGTRLLLGNALVASLFLSLRQRGVEIWTDTPLVALNAAGGRIDSAVCSRSGTPVTIHARRAVVLATGGFAASESLRAAIAPHFPVHWSLAANGATGDALTVARAIGASVELDHAAPMFFMPASIVRHRTGPPFPFPHVIADRARPGVIAVDRSGRRFVNEADSYHDVVMAMYAGSTRDTPSAFLVCDRDFIRRYGIGIIRPVWQWLPHYVDGGYVIAAPTIAALAQRLGIPPRALEETIERYNADAKRGDDPAFGKGGNALNRFNGDPDVTPNPCVRPIGAAALFRRADRSCRGRHERRLAHGCILARARRPRCADRRTVCMRQRPGVDHARNLCGRRHHAGPGNHVRLSRDRACARRWRTTVRRCPDTDTGAIAMRWLTLGFLNCAEIAPLELVDVAANAGFASVGIRITGRRLGDPYTPVIGNADAIAEIGARLRERRLRLSNVSAWHLYPEVGIRELTSLVETVARLNGEMILLSCYDADRARFCATVRSYAELAAAHGLKLAFEFVPFSQGRSLDDALDIARAVDRENFGLVIDPLHLARSGSRPEDLAKVPRELFAFAQLCDGPREKPPEVDLATEARTMRLDPGTGGLRMREILDALPKDVELECEFPTTRNLALAPAERARQIRAAAEGFLAEYDRHSSDAGAAS